MKLLPGNETSTTLETGRQRLAQPFTQVVDPHKAKQEAANLSIYGKPSGHTKEMDDPKHIPLPKIAMKRVRYDELPSSQLQIAQEDFQRELVILLELMAKPSTPSLHPSQDASVSAASTAASAFHPNIIELYGIGFEDRSGNVNGKKKQFIPFTKDLQPSFLLLSQIRNTLAQRLEKWRDDRGIGIYEALSMDINKRRNHWVERLLVLSKVAHAIQHLHDRQIIYRDTKPANIGYDALDVPKVFDFGLAKIITDDLRFRDKQRKGEKLEEGMFHLTPETGTLRYMATEVGKGRPYGWSADVYSLAILMYEVLTLKVPFGGIPPRQFREIIWNQGHGLVVDHSWPDSLQELIEKMWNSNPHERPTIHQVVLVLDDMLRGSDQDLFPKSLVLRGRRFSLF